MRRRNVPKYGSLTSLLDVLFILMFASLAQAAALVEKAREQPTRTEKRSPDETVSVPAGTRDAGVGSSKDAGALDGSVAAASLAKDAGADPGAPRQKQLYDKAIDKLTRSLKRRRPIYAHVSAFGALEVLAYTDAGTDKRVQVSTPLVHKSADVDVEWVYRNDGICNIVRTQLKLDSLENELIVVVIENSADPSAQNLALIRGLKLEASRCDKKGLLHFEAPDSASLPTPPTTPSPTTPPATKAQP